MRRFIVGAYLIFAACHGDHSAPPDRKVGVLTPRLRELAKSTACKDGPLNDEVSAAANEQIIPKVSRRLAKRRLAALTCPSTANVVIVYAADDNSLYVVSVSTLSMADARSWLDALQEAGLPPDLAEQGRQRLATGGAAYADIAHRGMSADGVINLSVDVISITPNRVNLSVAVLE